MGKKLIIIILTIVITAILLISYIGTIAYSVTNIEYNFSDFTYNPTINMQLNSTPPYIGYIEVKTDVAINNKGFYNIKGLTVTVEVYAENWQFNSSLNGDQVGNAVNNIGDILAGSSWTGTIGVNITKDIQNFAIENCSLKVIIKIHLIYEPIISIPIDYTTEQTKSYTSPF